LSFDQDGAETEGGMLQEEEKDEVDAQTQKPHHHGGYDSWLLERRVKVSPSAHDDNDNWMNLLGDSEGDVGDSCCFGTRTVQVGAAVAAASAADCVWKMHGARDLI